MKKRGLIALRIFFFVAAAITSGFIVYIVQNDSENILESILALSSIMVTLILGVITLYQTNTQTQMDMIDKTPYFRIVKDTEFEHHIQENTNVDSEIDAKTLYMYTKFLYFGNYVNFGSAVTLEVENISNCIIKRVTKYVCEGKKYSCGGKFVRYKNTKLLEFCNSDEGKEYHNNFNLNENEYDLVCGDKFMLSFIVGDGKFIDEAKSSGKEYDFSVAFEIETVHGYVYTQYMEFSVKPVDIKKGADWVTITYYDVDIKSEKISQKFLQK